MTRNYSEGTIPSIITNKEQILENLPKEIKENGLFCLWKYQKRGKELTKPPINPNYYLKESSSYRKKEEYYSKSNDKTRFNHLDKVLSLTSSRYGIGFGIFDTFGAIDLDHCLNEEGKIIQDDFAKIVVDILKELDTYTEKSPSGTGLHLYFKIKDLKMSPEEYSKKYMINKRINKETNQGIEVYLSGMTKKFLTITGDRIGDKDFREITFKELEPILEKYMKRYNAQQNTTSSLVTNQKDFLKIGLEKDSLLIDLYNDTSHSGNESEEDMRLLSKLAYYCNRDSRAIREAFESSPYFQTKDEEHLQKWNRGGANPYSSISIENAINLVSTTASEDNEKFMKNNPQLLQTTPTTPTEKEIKTDLDSLSLGRRIDRFFDIIEKQTFKSIPTGFKTFDEKTNGGFLNQSLITLGGGTSTGKTTFALNLALNFAKTRPVLYYSLEMGEEMIQAKIFSNISYKGGGMTIPSDNFLKCYDKNIMTEYQQSKVREELEKHEELNQLFIRYPRECNIDYILKEVKIFNEELEKQGKEKAILFVDYLQYLQGNPREDSQSLIKRIQRELKKYTIENDSLVILLIANSREADTEGKKSSISGGRDSSDIEYSSEYNLQLNFTEWERDEKERKTSRTELKRQNPRRMTITIHKNRMGMTGEMIDFSFYTIANTFQEKEKESENFYSHKRNQEKSFNGL